MIMIMKFLYIRISLSLILKRSKIEKNFVNDEEDFELNAQNRKPGLFP